jgi:hypothetical protein
MNRVKTGSFRKTPDHLGDDGQYSFHPGRGPDSIRRNDHLHIDAKVDGLPGQRQRQKNIGHQRAVARDLVMLDGLRRGNDGGIENRRGGFGNPA